MGTNLPRIPGEGHVRNSNVVNFCYYFDWVLTIKINSGKQSLRFITITILIGRTFYIRKHLYLSFINYVNDDLKLINMHTYT